MFPQQRGKKPHKKGKRLQKGSRWSCCFCILVPRMHCVVKFNHWQRLQWKGEMAGGCGSDCALGGAPSLHQDKTTRRYFSAKAHTKPVITAPCMKWWSFSHHEWHIKVLMDDRSICFSIFYEKVKMHEDLLQLCVRKESGCVHIFTHPHFYTSFVRTYTALNTLCHPTHPSPPLNNS